MSRGCSTHIYTNDELIARAERHERSHAQIKLDKIKSIEQEELKARCVVPLNPLFVISFGFPEVRKEIRAIAGNKKLLRWMVKK